ncbi:hypothetical protein K438DRAFT_1982646 [Mycena galopus ATCC 62051]|nr:hypothetical protein K438DRAFT_1982646 [Mycena galopus ATCC 62051]
MNDGDTARFQTHMLSSDVPDSLQIGPNIMHASVALRVLAPKLTKAQLLVIGGVHNVPIKPRMSFDELKTALENHKCNCPSSVTVFRYATRQQKTAEQTIRRTSRRDRARAKEQVKYSQAFKLHRDLQSEAPSVADAERECSFPPAPASDELRESIIRDFCDDFNPTNFVEAGCAVCGRLTSKKQLTSKDDLMLDWDILVPEECTVQERFNPDDPVECMPGPSVKVLSIVAESRFTHLLIIFGSGRSLGNCKT